MEFPVNLSLIFLLQNICVFVHCDWSGVSRLEEVFTWKRFTFQDQGQAGQNGSYFDFPMGLEVDNDRLLLSFARRSKTTPVGLGYVQISSTSSGKSPSVIPYPNKAYNDLNTPSAGKIVTVYRTRKDSCNRLWFIDTGILYSSGVANVIQQPSLIIMDLTTDAVIKNYTLINGRDVLYNDPSGLVSITLDMIGNDCKNTFAYIPDIFHKGILVYSLKDNDSWRVRHNFLGFDPDEGDFDVNGLKFQLGDGIFSIALGPVTDSKYHRTAYFHAFGSYKERAVNTMVLRNKTLATRRYHGNDFLIVGYRGFYTNSNIHTIDLSASVLLFIQPSNNAITCWNIQNGHLEEFDMEIIAQDDALLSYPSDLKVDGERNMWILCNKFPQFLFSTLNPNKVNFRIYRAPVDYAIQGTKCASSYNR